MATSQVSLVAHMASRVEDWCSVWKLSAEQHRSLLLLLSKVLLADHQANQSLQVIIRFLQTYNGQPLDNVALGVLNTALVDAISSPLESFPDRAKLYEAISSTNVSGDSAKLLSLLKILCDGSLEEFSSFSKSNADIFASHKLNSNDLEHNMRILTLCSLAAQVSPKREISFADISTALKVDISEVELWVVEAIAAGLLDASIDQLQSMVTVTRYSYRAFGLEDWKALQKGLKDLSQQVHVAVASVQTKAM